MTNRLIFTALVAFAPSALASDVAPPSAAELSKSPTLKKGDAVLRQTVDKFIQDFTESGDEQRLYQRWFAPYGVRGVVMVE